MADGKGCECNAWNAMECACDADWTPQEIYDLRKELQQAKARMMELEEIVSDNATDFLPVVLNHLEEYYPHDGDCTKQNYGCILCVVEQAINEHKAALTAKPEPAQQMTGEERNNLSRSVSRAIGDDCSSINPYRSAAVALSAIEQHYELRRKS